MQAASGSGSGGAPSAPGPSAGTAPKSAGIPADQCRNTACATRAAGKKFTPQLREGPLGPATLCNSCGIRWRREVLRREQEAEERAAKAAAVAPRHVSILPPGAPRAPVVVYQDEQDYESEDSASSEEEGQAGQAVPRQRPGTTGGGAAGPTETEDVISPATHKRMPTRVAKPVAQPSDMASPAAAETAAPARGSTGSRTQQARRAPSADQAKPAPVKGETPGFAYGSHAGQQARLTVEVDEVDQAKVDSDVATAPANTPAADVGSRGLNPTGIHQPGSVPAAVLGPHVAPAHPGPAAQPVGTQEALPAALTAVAGVLSSISGAFLAMVELMHSQGSQPAPGQGQEGTHANVGHVNAVEGSVQAAVPYPQYSNPFQPPTPASSAQHLLNMAPAALAATSVLQASSAFHGAALHGSQVAQPSGGANIPTTASMQHNTLAPVTGPMHVLSTTQQVMQHQPPLPSSQLAPAIQQPQLTMQGMQSALGLAQLLLSAQQSGFPHPSLQAMLPAAPTIPSTPVPAPAAQSAAAGNEPPKSSASPILASTAADLLLSLQHAPQRDQAKSTRRPSGKRAVPLQLQADAQEPGAKRRPPPAPAAPGHGTGDTPLGLMADNPASRGPGHGGYGGWLQSSAAGTSAQPPPSQTGYMILQHHPHMAIAAGSSQQGSLPSLSLLGPAFLPPPGLLGLGGWAPQQAPALGGEIAHHGSSGSSTAAQSPPVPSHQAATTVESGTDIPTHPTARASSGHGRRRRGEQGALKMPEQGRGVGASGSDGD